jgi:hypothetical protein
MVNMVYLNQSLDVLKIHGYRVGEGNISNGIPVYHLTLKWMHKTVEVMLIERSA